MIPVDPWMLELVINPPSPTRNTVLATAELAKKDWPIDNGPINQMPIIEKAQSARLTAPAVSLWDRQIYIGNALDSRNMVQKDLTPEQIAEGQWFTRQCINYLSHCP